MPVLGNLAIRKTPEIKLWWFWVHVIRVRLRVVQLWYLLTGNTDMQTTEMNRPGHVKRTPPDEQQTELHTAHSVLQQG